MPETKKFLDLNGLSFYDSKMKEWTDNKIGKGIEDTLLENIEGKGELFFSFFLGKNDNDITNPSETIDTNDIYIERNRTEGSYNYDYITFGYSGELPFDMGDPLPLKVVYNGVTYTGNAYYDGYSYIFGKDIWNEANSDYQESDLAKLDFAVYFNEPEWGYYSGYVDFPAGTDLDISVSIMSEQSKTIIKKNLLDVSYNDLSDKPFGYKFNENLSRNSSLNFQMQHKRSGSEPYYWTRLEIEESRDITSWLNQTNNRVKVYLGNNSVNDVLYLADNQGSFNGGSCPLSSLSGLINGIKSAIEDGYFVNFYENQVSLMVSTFEPDCRINESNLSFNQGFFGYITATFTDNTWENLQSVTLDEAYIYGPANSTVKVEFYHGNYTDFQISGGTIEVSEDTVLNTYPIKFNSTDLMSSPVYRVEFNGNLYDIKPYNMVDSYFSIDDYDVLGTKLFPGYLPEDIFNDYSKSWVLGSSKFLKRELGIHIYDNSNGREVNTSEGDFPFCIFFTYVSDGEGGTKPIGIIIADNAQTERNVTLYLPEEIKKIDEIYIPEIEIPEYDSIESQSILGLFSNP